MAEGKKSFVLYCDLIHTVNKMPDYKAGLLFKTILSYVNDENPAVPDLVVDLVFEPIKQMLKRDLKKWERYINKQSNNGKKGGRPKNPSLSEETQKTQALNGKPKKADSVSVSVSVSDNVTTAVPELGIEIVKKVSNEVWKDQGWKELACMGLSITVAELKKWMALFNSSVSNSILDGVFDNARYKKMCQGWILYQQSKGNTVETGIQKTSNSPTLKILGND